MILGAAAIALARRNLGRDWVTYLERFGMPHTIAERPPARYWARRIAYHRRKANRTTRRKP